MPDGTLSQGAAFVLKRSSSLPAFLGKVIDWSVILMAFLTPLWFLPVTLDVLELNKQTLLVVLTMVAVISWVAKSLLERSFSLARSWMHLVVILFLIGYKLISYFSVDWYLSFIGNVGQMQWAFATVAALVLMYFVIVNRFKTAGNVYDLVLWSLLGSCIAGLYGLLQLAGIHLFGNGGVTGTNAFNTIGTANALGVFMVVPAVIAASLTVLGCRERTCVLARGNWVSKFWQGVIWATLVVGLLVAVVVDFWVIWAGLLFGMVLVVVIPFLRTRKFGHPVTLAVPTVLAVVSVLLLLFRTPVNLNVPSEVSPSAMHSWNIARQVLRDDPLVGTGPGTWIYDYAKYRSVAVNVSQFWTIRFERGLSTFLTMLATLGLVGTSLWLILVISAIVISAHHLVTEKNDDAWQAYLTVFVGWASLVFLAFFYNYNVAHHFAFWFLLGLLGILVTRDRWTWDNSKGWVTSVLSVAFIVLAVGAISMTWLAGQRLVADAKYSQAVRAFQRGDSIDDSINALQSAVSLNRLNDVYDRNLSQALLVKVARNMQEQPTEELAKQVNDQVAKAVEVAKRATEIAPANVDNWSNLAIVYQAIASFTRGADEFAVRHYNDALQREPNNPVFMNEVGKLYVLRSDAYRTLLNSPDQAARDDAQKNVNDELGKAAEWFNKAIAVKPDYAAAHFNLGLVYERQGNLKDSIRKLEEVLGATPQDIGVAFQLAILYYRDGNKDASRQLFEQIVQAEPSYANARWFLSSIYEEQGLYELAIEQVQAVKKTNADNAAVDQRLADLEQKRATNAKPTPQPLPTPLEQNIQGPEDQRPVQAP